MSPESNLDVLRRFVEAFNRRDVDSIAADLDPRWSCGSGPRRQARRATAAPTVSAAHWRSGSRPGMQIEINDTREVDDRMLVTLHQRAKGRGSEIEIEIESHNVYTFDDGKVIRMELFINRDDALEAAGLTASLEEGNR
jgi:hypothetical protein